MNDGWHDIDYDLGLGAEGNARVSDILNEACHVFHHHAGGTWREHDRDRYASLLGEVIRTRRALIRVLLNTDDRVVKNIAYRAVELLGGQPKPGSDT